jgi:7-cyano-7-deazaguanine synthase
MAEPRPGAVVLLSSGLDSTFNLVEALATMDVRLVLTFDYGQRAALREVERSRLLVRHFQTKNADLKHEVIDLKWFTVFTQTSLLGKGEVPTGQAIGIDDLKKSLESAKSVWVPNRNGIFLNVAAGFAEGLKARFVIPGFNREEAQTFPDNTGEFLKTLDECWKYSTAYGVATHCFSTDLDKTQIVAKAKKAGAPFGLMWPCYFSFEEWCGECESCQRFKRALSANGLSFEELKKRKVP